MAFDPKEPRDKGGKWTAGSGSGSRWGRMSSTAKAKLTSRAQFSGTSQSKGAMRGRAISEGGRAKPGKVFSDERLISYHRTDTSQLNEKKKGKGSFKVIGTGPKVLRDQPQEMAFFARHESPAAVAIQTAKALERDFHNARDKAIHAEMAAAIAKHQGAITKYPSAAEVKAARLAKRKK